MCLLNKLNFAIQEDFFFLFFDKERWFVDGFAVGCNLLIFLLIGCFCVRFAVEDHLRPNTVGLEHI